MTVALVSRSSDVQDRLEAFAREDDCEKLVRQLQVLRGLTAEAFLYSAAIVRRLREKNYPIPMKGDAIRTLDLIASGRLLPEVAEKWHHSPKLIRNAALMDEEQQLRITNDEPFQIADLEGTHRLVGPCDLTEDDITQLFDKDRLRSEQEQISWLRDQQRERQLRNAASVDSDIEIDTARGCVIIHGVHGDKKLTVTELGRIIAELGRGRGRRRRVVEEVV